jgi:hypothetical protein
MSTAGSIAVIFLTIEALIVCLVPLALLAGLVYGMFKLRRALVLQVLPKGQELTARLYRETRAASDKVAAPFMAAHTVGVRAHTSTRAAGRTTERTLRKARTRLGL